MNAERLTIQHPLLARIAEGTRWRGKDQFPSEIRRDNVITWLEYIHSKNEFERFLPRLKDVPAKRDEALAEIYAAYFVEKYAGYPITTWEPPGNNGKLGEFSFTPEGTDVFCEVKSPGWEREIVESEGPSSPRLKKPKHLPGDHGWFDNSDYARDAVAKAYPKFPSDKPTLLILVDDLKVSLSDDPIGMRKALYEPGMGCFATNKYCNLGAVAVLDIEKSDPSLCMYHNPRAIQVVILPKKVFAKYQQICESTGNNMSSLNNVRFNSAEEMPPEADRDTRRFDFHFSYSSLGPDEKARENTLTVRIVVPGLEAIRRGQSLEKILYWLAAQNLSALIEKQATGLQLIEFNSIPSCPDPSTIQYPPKVHFSTQPCDR